LSSPARGEIRDSEAPILETCVRVRTGILTAALSGDAAVLDGAADVDASAPKRQRALDGAGSRSAGAIQAYRSCRLRCRDWREAALSRHPPTTKP
jgi:hypothetical protein